MVTLAGFAAVILIAAIVSTLLAIRATTAERLASQRLTESEEARRQSEEARQQAEAVTRRLVDMFRRTDPNLDGRQLKVVDLLDQTTRDLDAEFPGTSKIKGELLHVLGETHYGLGLYDRSVELLTRALAARQAALGPDHPDTLKSMSSLAENYMDVGRWREAMPRLEEVVRLQKAKLGPDDPDTLESMHGLAWAYLTAGRRDEAISLNKEVFKRRQKVLGPDHRDTLHSMQAVADGYAQSGQIDEAIALQEETLKLRKAKLGRDHYGTLQSMTHLAWAYVAADRLNEAIPLFEEALEHYKAKLGPDHTYIGQLTHGRDAILGRILLRQKEYAKAEPLLREVVSYRERTLPNEREWFIRSLLGESLLGQKKYAEAEPLLIKGYEGMKERDAKIPAPVKHRLTEAGERVVRLYDNWGKPKEAAEWRAKLARELPAENSAPKP
jgi:tetratricopeptide (TPR) repeat protein